MGYQDTLQELAQAGETAASRLREALESGEITVSEFSELLAASLEVHDAKADVLALQAFTTQAAIGTRQAQPVPVLPVSDRRDRLIEAAATIAAAGAEHRSAMAARIGRAEPLSAAADTMNTAISGSDLVQGWTRQVNAGGCQLCRWWARDGQVWPKTHRMPTHTGCACVQRPVWTKAPKPRRRRRRR